MTRYLLVLIFSFIFMPLVSAENQNSWSFSMGQFDVNDSNDSSEIRLERLSGKNMFGDMELKPFVGFSSFVVLSLFKYIILMQRPFLFN